MHQTTGRWKLGLALSLTTALMWGLLAIDLKLLLAYMDPASITWYRMLTASVLLGLFMKIRGTFPNWHRLRGKIGLLLLIAAMGLTGNFVLYLFSLNYITPGVAQVLVQLAPVFLLLGSVLIFKESFSRIQFLGLIILVIGMLIFMNQRLSSLMSQLDTYTIGVLIMIASAVVWAVYALLQKKLLKELPSESILFWVYLGSSILLLPAADFASVKALDSLGWGLLFFACANTLIAYGGFAEALNHWEASRISAVLALIPLFTLIFVAILHYFFPDIMESENLNLLAYFGAIMVVCGSAMTALAGQKQSLKKSPR